MKLKKTSINLKYKLLIAISVACAIPFVFGALYLNTFFGQWFTSYYESNTKQLLMEVDDYLHLALNTHMSEITNEISEDSRVKHANNSIRNYTEYDKDKPEQPKTVEKELSTYFENIKNSHTDILYVFLGLDDGSYMEYPEFKPNAPYDPRLRPWYLNTVDANEVMMSEPYTSKVTSERVISFTKRLKLDNGQLGVIGIAVSIEALTDKIEKTNIDSDGYIIVLNKTNHIITSPHNPDWIFKSVEELNIPVLTQSVQQSKMHEGSIEGEEKLVYAYVSSNSGYTEIAVLSPSIFNEKVNGVTMILIGVFVLTFVLLLYVSNYVANRFTEPIIIMSDSLRNIKEDFIDIAIDEDIKSYVEQRDEIGTIASAIHVLITNIQNSFELLLKKNEEISISNQMLASSEEELISQLEEIAEKKQLIEYLAMHDSLTDIPNRRFFYDALNKYLLKHEYGAIILMDVDNFKRVNDMLGHKIGDDLLIAVARKLTGLMDDKCVLSRFGGDEFFIIRRFETRDQVHLFLEHIKKNFEAPLIVGDHSLDIQFSIGTSFYPEDSTDVNQLIVNADLAMYHVKNRNKNDYAFYSNDLMDYAVEKTVIVNQIKEALAQDGFKMVYQPVVNCNTGEIESFEALLRFKQHSVAPSKFIAIAEEEGLIISVGRQVVEMVVNQLNIWKTMGINIKPVSINFSAKQLYDHGFFQFVKAILDEYSIEPQYLKVEMTESVFFENKDVTLKLLHSLRRMGIKVLIDDFGTGYSSLGYLTLYPIDVVKLDKSINERYSNHESSDVIHSIIKLVHSLKLEVVAEGIETKEQLVLLQAQECNYVQGYVFSRPVDANEVGIIIDQVYF